MDGCKHDSHSFQMKDSNQFCFFFAFKMWIQLKIKWQRNAVRIGNEDGTNLRLLVQLTPLNSNNPKST